MRAILISMAVTSLFGVMGIARHWIADGLGAQAMVRGGMYFGAIVAMHVLGYQLYCRQPIRWSGQYWPAIYRSAIYQLLASCFVSIFLVSGLTEMWGISLIGYWVCVAIIACRRPEKPTGDDLQFIQYGFFALLMITWALVMHMPRVADLRW